MTEPYAPQFNPLSYICRRCGALVHFSDEAKALHDEFHARNERTTDGRQGKAGSGVGGPRL